MGEQSDTAAPGRVKALRRAPFRPGDHRRGTRLVPRNLDRFSTGVHVLDGGTGSELRRRGVAPIPGAWLGPALLEHGATLAAIHRDFVAAGAELCTTATFAATPFLFEAAGLANRWREAVHEAVRAARAAAPVAVLGALSNLPPAPDGWPPPAEERAAYGALAEALLEEGVDGLVLEMVQERTHGGRLLDAAGAAADRAGVPLWLGVSARLRDDGTLVAFDFPDRPLLPELDALLARRRPDALLVMHTPLEDLPWALTAVRERWDGLLGARPELPYAPDVPDAPEPPENVLARAAPAWRAAGATLLGGCCGTRPAHVAALARTVV
jgi:methionine synthase I (cobalamin-dependent)